MKLLEYLSFLGLIILLRVLDFITYDTLVICVIVLGIGDRIITKIDESKCEIVLVDAGEREIEE